MVPKLRDFEGRWRIARTIEDRLGREGRFDGEAVFAAQGAVLHYRETGELRLGDGPGFQAERVVSLASGGRPDRRRLRRWPSLP